MLKILVLTLTLSSIESYKPLPVDVGSINANGYSSYPSYQQPAFQSVPWHLTRLSAGRQWSHPGISLNAYALGSTEPSPTYDQLEQKREMYVFLLDTGVDTSCTSFEGRVTK